MSSLSNVFGSGGGGGVGNVKFLTGNSGGPVGPDGIGNINVVGDGTTITVADNPGTNTLTISTVGSSGVTIDGDTGSAAGSTIAFNANTGTANAGSSISFSASGSTVDFNTTDGNGNTILGILAGNSSISGQFNASFGEFTLNGLSSGTYNAALGKSALQALSSGNSNIAVGSQALSGLGTGSGNTVIGTDAGSSYSGSESNNIILGPSAGTTSTSGEMWLGDFTNTTTTYVAGISGVTVSNINAVTINTSTGQLGSEAFPAAGITLTGDTGGALGPSSSFTFDAVTQAGSSVSFSGSGTILSLNTSDTGNNTIIGLEAGNSNIVSNGGELNTGLGVEVLSALTSGTNNVAIGQGALNSLTSGSNNTAVGQNSLLQTTTSSNCALGQGTLFALTSGDGSNVAVGLEAGFQLTSGANNTFLGFATGYNYTGTESNNICIGTNSTELAGESNVLRIGGGTGTDPFELNQAFISGIQGITVTGAAVLVSASDQLGVAVSSRKFKDNIRDMDNYSSAILNLRPTVFNYKGSTETTGGLIAEEVEEIMPDLVVYDKAGDAQTVKYHELPALLLNELQKALARIAALEAKLGV